MVTWWDENFLIVPAVKFLDLDNADALLTAQSLQVSPYASVSQAYTLNLVASYVQLNTHQTARGAQTLEF